MAKLYLTILVALVLAHATARNIPTDDHKEEVTKNPNIINTNTAFAPAESTTLEATAAASPTAKGGAALGDQKNFISYGGVGGWGGVGGYVGFLPVFGGIGGIGGASGIGGIGGLGGVGLGKVGGIGVGGGVGGVGGVGGIFP